MDLNAINQIGKYLDVRVSNVTQNNDQTFQIKSNGKDYKGLAAIVLKLAEESKNMHWTDKTQESLIYQWLEFVALHGIQLNSSTSYGKIVLKELNTLLENYSYLVGFTRTLADVVVYHLLYKSIESLSPSEKESYMNLSRWFDHIQQDKKVRQDNALINFSTMYISNRAAGRH